MSSKQKSVGQKKAAPKIEVNDVSKRAMLVDLDITVWRVFATDSEASDEVTTKHKAEKGAGSFVKALVPRGTARDTVREVIREARQFHNDATLPWFDRGVRILTSAAALNYFKDMAKRKRDFESAVQQCSKDLPTIKAKAKLFLGDLYKEEDYPSPESLKSMFSFNVRVMPFPKGDDFRVAMSKDEAARIKKEINEQVEQGVLAAMRNLWSTLHRLVGTMRERLKDEDKRITAAMFNNLKELCDSIPALNVSGDPELMEAKQAIEAELTKYNADQVRTSTDLRKRLGKKAEEIEKKIAGWLY